MTQTYGKDRTFYPPQMDNFSTLYLLEPHHWLDYELLDSGEGLKLERFGPYRFVRPEVQAMWKQSLPKNDWAAAHAVFQSTGEESGGHWSFKKKISVRWEMSYGSIRFWAMTTPGRHLGVFPEAASHWDFVADLIRKADRSLSVLNLFGYTGLATLAAAGAGAKVTHVDASKKSVTWARENQSLSSLNDKPIRWIVDDAVKFVLRESRRGARYDGIILDPPKFGRGPKGEVWEVYKSLPKLLEACRSILNERPLFLIMTLYAVKASALNVGQALQNMMATYKGRTDCGELLIREKSAGHMLSQAVFARWQAG